MPTRWSPCYKLAQSYPMVSVLVGREIVGDAFIDGEVALLSARPLFVTKCFGCGANIITQNAGVQTYASCMTMENLLHDHYP
jgi:hypothetical protein